MIAAFMNKPFGLKHYPTEHFTFTVPQSVWGLYIYGKLCQVAPLRIYIPISNSK